ncbi:MAG: DNA polymerase III subunit delta [bacterium]|nr:DNA polymerase III subunit delta [bacterium]MCP4799576.1 DNA polymerase III subunit delta [bacterium]
MAKRKPSGNNIQTLRSEFKSGSTKLIYLLEGENPDKVRGIVDYLSKMLLGDTGAAFNFHKYDGDQHGIDKPLQQAVTIPMMSNNQLLWIKNADKSVTDQALEEALLNYLEKPEQSTVIIFSANKFDGRKKWVKSAKSAGYFYDLNPPKGIALVSSAISEAKKHGLVLDNELAELLVEMTGEDQIAITTELAKIGLIVDDNGIAKREDILKIILDQRSVDVFSFVNAIGPGKTATGLEIFRKYLAEGRSVYEIAPLLIWKIKQIALVQSLLDEGVSEGEIPGRAGMSPYAAKQSIVAAKSWGLNGVKAALFACNQCEKDLKGSPLGPEIVLERTILSICNPDS